MPSFEEKAIFRQITYIQNKFKRVYEETECVITLLQKCLYVFDRRVKELTDCDGENFISLYRKLNSDFEDFQEKLIYVQASIEVPPDCDNLPKEAAVSVEENSSQNNQECSTHNTSRHSTLNASTVSHISACDVSEPSPVSCNTLVKSVQSSSSTSYASIRDTEESNTFKSDHDTLHSVLPDLNTGITLEKNPPTQSNESVTKLENPQKLFDHVTLVESLSQTSCYRSLSSNLSDLCYQYASSGQENFENFSTSLLLQSDSQLPCCPKPIKKVIPPLSITLPMTTTAMLSHIENPGNFWMQLESSKTSMPSFPREKYFNLPIPSHVEEGDFCLAPSKSVPFYLRVQIISDLHKDEDDVKVFFIDHGSSQTVSLHELRVMPPEAYDIPMQAIHCFLAEISAPNNIWCFAAIRKFREFGNNCIETNITTQNGDKYGVQLVATISMFDEEFSCDIGQTLCYDGFAIENEPSQVEDSISTPVLCSNKQTYPNQINNQLSSDSGVSVTSNQRCSPSDQTQCSSSEALNAFVLYDSSQPSKEQLPCDKAMKLDSGNDIKSKDLISFESIEELCNETIESLTEHHAPVYSTYNQCLKVCTCKCPLHLIIPFPAITFVEEDMVLVMLSHIVNPNEFYVNMAMESSTTLDELMEQMTIAYSSLSSQDAYSIVLDDLKEGMFCAACFEDGNWYRVKVISIHLKFDQSPNVYVQYVDYGNKAWIKNTDLRTLTPEFAEPPSYSVKCSLAGVIPISSTDSKKGESQLWSDEAVKVFKEMIVFEHCLTAQICDRATVLNDDPLQVLLWDTVSKQDILINKIFVESGLAELDLNLLQALFNTRAKNFKDQKFKVDKCLEAFNHWDPMTEEYNAVQNSYGVNMDDFQVAIDGYKYNDEEYICKYFSLRGYCPRGHSCPYEHVSLAEGGVTRDRDEHYSLNSYPLLPDNNSYVFIQVSSVISPSCFYVQLPFGNLNVDEIDSRVNRGASRESLQNQEVYALFQALNTHYTNKPFDERTTIALPEGNIVVARRQYDQAWHRARIIELLDIDRPAKVFYVDFGNEEWVDRRNIREILPEFLHTPFQAVECCLSDVEPLGSEKGLKWSSNAVSCFKNLVSETVMLAHVEGRYDNLLLISLRRTTKNDHMTVREHLIREGFAQDKTQVIKNKRESRYVPG